MTKGGQEGDESQVTTVGKDGGVIELVGQAMMVALDTKEETRMRRVAQRSPMSNQPKERSSLQ